MRVLVTGATGFLGKHVVREITRRGHCVIAVVRKEAQACATLQGGNVALVKADIHDENLFQTIVEAPVDALVHLAWPGLPNYNELTHFEVNYPAAYKFIKMIVERGTRQVLVTGTCLEYGIRDGCLHENMSTDPVNAYALAKDALRKSLRILQSEVPFVLQWARLFYMYGAGQNPRSLLAQLESALTRGDLVFKMSPGEQLRDYLPVEDVAYQLVSLLEARHADGVFNLCSGVPISVRRLVEQRVKESGKEIRLHFGYYQYPQYEPMAFWGDNKKMKSIIGDQR